MVNGLASNEINSVTQDGTGFLWIASNNGLQRFDGIHYKTFRHEAGNAASIPQNVVVEVFIDKKDQLWLLSAHGDVGIFDKNTFTYKPIAVRPRNSNALSFSEKHLIADDFGNLFLLLESYELLYYNSAKQEFSADGNFLPLKKEWGITSLSQQPGTKKYWVGLYSRGLAIYNAETGNLSYKGHNTEHEPAIELIDTFYHFHQSHIDKKGRVWFENWMDKGGFPYFMMYDASNKKTPLQKYELISTLKKYHELRGSLETTDGHIWLRGKGVFACFNEEENKLVSVPSDFRNEQGIVYEETTSLFQDREKNIWVSTRNNGLYRFNPGRQYFTNVPHWLSWLNRQGGSDVMSFIETKSGDVLSSAWAEGMYRYNARLKQIPLAIAATADNKTPSVWSMCASADSNTIWMACQPGLNIYDQQKNTLRFRNPSQLQNRTIRQVAEDGAGNLWLGMHGTGVYRWINPKNFSKDSLIKLVEPGNTVVNKIVKDSKGVMWIATGSEGIFAYDGTSGRLLKRWNLENNRDQEFIGHGVSGILEYSDSLMLISNAAELFFYNRRSDKLTKVLLPGGLMGSIAAIEKDNAGFLWISTTNALYRYHLQKKILVLYNRTDGITDDRFGLSACYKMKDGRLLFGTSTSFVAFDPKAIMGDTAKQKVEITSLEIGKNSLRIDSVMELDQLTLSHKENSISIEFSTLSYAAPALVQYKMEGIDYEWRSADKNNGATFPFLPPARYTLLLRTVNAEGVITDVPTKLHFYIRPPFYQTWWFYTLVAIGFVAELWWLDRQRSLRKKGLQKVRTDISDNLHKDINEALNNINILSEIARLKSDKEPQKAKEFLEQIHSKSHNMIIAMDDMLWSLDPQNDSMDKTISRIKEFADALMQRHPVIIELLIDKNVERLQLNMKLRHEAFLLFKETLRILVEAGTRHCIVHLAMEKAKLLFTIEFENEGCDRQQLNNLLQRRDMEARLQVLGAKLDVQVHKSRSVFMLQLPLG